MRLAGLLVADEPASRSLAVELFPHEAPKLLPVAELTPTTPFEGRLFELIERTARQASSLSGGGSIARPQEQTDCRPILGVVVPVAWYGELGEAHGLGAELPLVAVTDHVNLVGRGPLTGPWPAGRARDFPSLTALYRPEVILAVRRSTAGPIYSALAVAGVGDPDRLTAFERRQMQRCGLSAATAALVPSAIIAAYFGLAVAAAGAPRPPRPTETEEREL